MDFFSVVVLHSNHFWMYTNNRYRAKSWGIASAKRKLELPVKLAKIIKIKCLVYGYGNPMSSFFRLIFESEMLKLPEEFAQGPFVTSLPSKYTSDSR